jgi:hypothetical protein
MRLLAWRSYRKGFLKPTPHFHSVASIACGVHGVRRVDLVWAGGSTAESRNRQGFHFRNPKTCPNNPDTSLH